MHELSLAQSMVEQALAAAEENAPGRRVTQVHVEVGELSGAVPELLREVFPMAAQGTVLADARLRIRRRKARFECRSCGESFAVGEGVGCPQCGSTRVDMTAGRDIRLTSIDVED
jgi:hydrogenase nickel incorporation protein HypA/HybF